MPSQPNFKGVRSTYVRTSSLIDALSGLYSQITKNSIVQDIGWTVNDYNDITMISKPWPLRKPK